MKQNLALSITSLLSILFATFHLTSRGASRPGLKPRVYTIFERRHVGAEAPTRKRNSKAEPKREAASLSLEGLWL